MKKLLLLIIFSIALKVSAQTYDNSWINYGQEYYKIKVWQKGIYRLTAQNLMLAGMPTASIDPRKLQVFHNGVEQYVYVQGETDGTFDNGDFLEFYGDKNDGWLDKRLYDDTLWQPTPQHSLFTDTAVYFITINITANGKRVTLSTD